MMRESTCEDILLGGVNLTLCSNDNQWEFTFIPFLEEHWCKVMSMANDPNGEEVFRVMTRLYMSASKRHDGRTPLPWLEKYLSNALIRAYND
jgi:hypothetical protein